MCNTLPGIVDHNSQLIGCQTVTTPDDKIAAGLAEVLRNGALDGIFKPDCLVCDLQPERIAIIR